LPCSRHHLRSTTWLKWRVILKHGPLNAIHVWEIIFTAVFTILYFRAIKCYKPLREHHSQDSFREQNKAMITTMMKTGLWSPHLESLTTVAQSLVSKSMMVKIRIILRQENHTSFSFLLVKLHRTLMILHVHYMF